MKLFLISFSKKMYYILAGCVVFIAFLVLISRVLIHTFDLHKHDFEVWASQLLNAPVQIERVQLDWYQYQPEITLKNVTLLNKQNNQPALQFENIRLFFSIPQSILGKTPVLSGMMISGVAVKVKQNTHQEFVIQGLPVISSKKVNTFSSENKATDILAWLSTQDRLILDNITVDFVDTKNVAHQLLVNNLSVGNNANQHVIMADARLIQSIPTSLTLTMTWQGQVTKPETLSTNVYLHLSDVSLSQWLSNQSFQDWKIKEGIGSAKVWLTYAHERLESAQTEMEFHGVNVVKSDNSPQQIINRLSGHLGLRRVGNQFILAGDDVLIDLPAHLWPITNFQIDFSSNKQAIFQPTLIHVGYLNLKDVSALLLSLPSLVPDRIQTLISGLNPGGELHNLTYILNKKNQTPENIFFKTDVRNVGWKQMDNLPAMKGLSADILWNGQTGNVSLHSKNLTFSDDHVFAKPLVFSQVYGEARFTQDKQSAWQLSVSKLRIENDDLLADVSGELAIPTTGSPNINLAGSFSVSAAENIARYLPLKTFHSKLSTWLKNAFIKGEVTSGYAKLHGKLTDFPFESDAQGLFEIGGVVSHINLIYDPDWPTVENIAGKIVFHNRSMTVDVVKASTLSIDANSIHANIPYLGKEKPTILTIQTGQIDADASAGLQFIQESPLKKTLGNMFSRMSLEGPINLTLGLTIPLDDPDETRVNGQIHFNNTIANLLPWQLAVTHLNGDLAFTESKTTADNIQGVVFNKPLTLSLKTLASKNKKNPVTSANILFHADVTDLDTWLKIPFSRWAQGSADFRTELKISSNDPMSAVLQSNLVGLTILLPDEYGKKSADARLFSSQFLMADNQPLKIQMKYSNLVSAALILDHDRDVLRLKGGNISLGDKMAEWPKSNGLILSGELKTLDWPTISKYSASVSETSNDSMSAPFTGADLKIGQLNLPGVTLNHAYLSLLREPGVWKVNVTSDQMIGEIKIPQLINRDSVIIADFDKLILPKNTKQSLSQPMDIHALPHLSIEADNVSYQDAPVGHITLETTPIKDGIDITDLKIDSPLISLKATGSWTQSGNKNNTFIKGQADTNHLSQFLSSLGFDAHNFDTQHAQFNFDTRFNSAPYSPDLNSLSGSLSILLGKGRIIELGQENTAKMDLGRMLNVFSLQTIPRRLSLDFSDMFQKGYSFDILKGDVTFDKGDAYTKNLYFEGPIARVAISGRIGLYEKDYDIRLSVTPHVTSSIPIAATLITGQPVVGLAAWAFDKMLSPEVSKVTTHYYNITGPWKNPVWTSGKR